MASPGCSRRRFTAALAAGGGIALAQNPPQNPADAQNTSVQPQQRRGTLPEVPPFQEPLAFARKDQPLQVRPFPMTQVRLLPGRFQEAQEWNRGYLHRLSVDRLLHTFRMNAGLPSSAQPLGGWERPGTDRGSELRGHFGGHFLSGCALAYASTGDQALKAKGDAMVAELAKCQQQLGGKYLSAFPTEFWDRLKVLQRVWAPFYTIHKIMAGMLDMYQHCGNRQALEVLQGMAAWADEWTAPISERHMQNILDVEYGGMNEVLYNLAAVTNDERWGKAGDRYTKKKFFNPLALRRDELRGLHVNTHIPQVIGAARRYELTGDLRFHDVADFFWYQVTTARAYVTGGTSNGEGWLAGPRQLAAELRQSVSTAECCCAYNMLKLTRQLYSWTADPRYFDYYERALFNHRLGTIQPETGATMYYLSHTPGAWKTFGTENDSFWCCTGSGVEEFAKLNDSIYYHDDDGVYVNLFVASELNWPEKGLRLRQETKFPEQAATALTITAEKPLSLALRLRIPQWLAGGAVRINGKPVEAAASPGSYLMITRTWKTGDRVEMELPMRLRTEAMPDDRRIQAVLYGPLVLAADLGGEGLTAEMMVGPNGPRMQRGGPPPAFPALRPERLEPASGLAFRQRDLTLVPLNSIFDRRYSIYFNVA